MSEQVCKPKRRETSCYAKNAIHESMGTYERHFMVGMNQISQTLDDLGLKGKELFDNDGLGKDMGHDSNGQNPDEQELLTALGVANSSCYPDPAEKLEMVFLWNLVLLYQMVENLVICCSQLLWVRNLDHNQSLACR